MNEEGIQWFFKESIGRTLVPFLFLGVAPSLVFYDFSIGSLFWTQIISGLGFLLFSLVLSFNMYRLEGEISLYSYSRPGNLYFKIITWSFGGAFLNSVLA